MYWVGTYSKSDVDEDEDLVGRAEAAGTRHGGRGCVVQSLVDHGSRAVVIGRARPAAWRQTRVARGTPRKALTDRWRPRARRTPPSRNSQARRPLLEAPGAARNVANEPQATVQ